MITPLQSYPAPRPMVTWHNSFPSSTAVFGVSSPEAAKMSGIPYRAEKSVEHLQEYLWYTLTICSEINAFTIVTQYVCVFWLQLDSTHSKVPLRQGASFRAQQKSRCDGGQQKGQKQACVQHKPASKCGMITLLSSSASSPWSLNAVSLRSVMTKSFLSSFHTSEVFGYKLSGVKERLSMLGSV